MGQKRDRPEPRERRSPSATLSHATDDFIQELGVPALPEGIPQRLEDAIRARVNALLFHLREAKREQYVKVIEVRLIREALGAVLTACELKLPDGQVLYATFRQLVRDLGYDRADVGFLKRSTPDAEPGE